MTLIKRLLAGIVLAAGMMFASVPALGTALVLGGPWTVLDQQMKPGDFFVAPDDTFFWTFTCPTDHCKLIVTDLFVISDQYEIFDGIDMIAKTPEMPDWDDLGFGDPGVGGGFPPWTDNPDVAFASGLYSSAIIFLGAGDHILSFRDIHIPPTTAGGDPFPDGTIAFRVTVPEPASLALLGIALVGLGFARRKS